MYVMLDSSAPNASTKSAQSDFPYGLLEFCTEDARLITVRRTGSIEVTLPLNCPSSAPAKAVPLTGKGR